MFWVILSEDFLNKGMFTYKIKHQLRTELESLIKLNTFVHSKSDALAAVRSWHQAALHQAMRNRVCRTDRAEIAFLKLTFAVPLKS